MDEYLDSIRALEQRVERTSEVDPSARSRTVHTKGLNLEVAHSDPAGVHPSCMYDLLYLALPDRLDALTPA